MDYTSPDQLNGVQMALTFLRNQTGQYVSGVLPQSYLRNLEAHGNIIVGSTSSEHAKQRAMGKYITAIEKISAEPLPTEVQTKVDIIDAYIAKNYAGMRATASQSVNEKS
jgi:hypothetical protein